LRNRTTDPGVVAAEDLLVHRDERLDALVVVDGHQVESLRQDDLEGELRDLCDEECLWLLGHETRGEQPVRQVAGLVVGVVLPLPRLSRPGEPGDLRLDDGVGRRLVEVRPRHAGPSVRGDAADPPRVALDDPATCVRAELSTDLLVEGTEDGLGIHPRSRPEPVARGNPIAGE